MTVPTFLNSTVAPFRFLEHLGVTSCDTVLTDVAAELLALSPPWTVVDNRPGTPSLTLTSPHDVTDPRFMQITLTNVAAASNLKCDMLLKDQSATTICQRRVNCPAGNSWNVRYYTGRYHFVLDFEMISAASECLIAGILDESPEAQTTHPHYVYGAGTRSSGDSPVAVVANSSYMMDDTTVELEARMELYSNVTPGNTVALISPSGARIWRPRVFFVAATGAGTYGKTIGGRGFQQLVSYSDIIPGIDYVVPIDIATTAKFRAIGGVNGSTFNTGLAFRSG